MIGVVISLAAVPLLAGLALFLLSSGLRAGDRAGDVRVTARMGRVTQPDGAWPVIVATVTNPGTVPVLVGLSARRARLPGWLDAGMNVTAPRRTRRHALRADRQDVLGVLTPGSTASWQVTVPAGQRRRCRLVAVVGQADRRLRVIGLVVAPSPTDPQVGGHRSLSERER